MGRWGQKLWRIVPHLTNTTLVVWLMARVIGVDRWAKVQSPVAPLLSLTPGVAAASLVATGLFRRKRDAAVALGFGALIGPRFISRIQPAANGPALNFLTVNMLYGRGSISDVIALVTDKKVDVLFLQEFTKEAAKGADEALLHEILPHTIVETKGRSPRGSAIYSRFALVPGLKLGRIGAAQPTARLLLDDGYEMEVVCVHPYPPKPVLSKGRVARWRQELSVLPPLGELPQALVGDFNATFDHQQFLRLLENGYVDAAFETGNAWRPTWGPENKPALLTLDHVLLDYRCSVLETSVHFVRGTDHRGVFARFQLPAS